MFWKTIICLFMIFVMTCSLMACNTKKENNSNSDKDNTTAEKATTQEAVTEEEEQMIVLTVMTDRLHLLNTKLAEYKAAFEKSHENVVVEFKAVKDYDTAITNRLKSGKCGDVLLIPNTIENKDLEQYFEPLGTVEELSESYEEKYIQERTVDGVVYGLPRYANVQGVAYNEIVFAKAGVIDFPTKSSDFLTMLKNIKNSQPNVIPYYTGYAEGVGLAQWQPHAWGSVSADADYRNNGIVNEESPFLVGKANYVAHRLLYDIVDYGLCESFLEEQSEENMTEEVEEVSEETEEKQGDLRVNGKKIFSMLNRGEIGCMVMSSEYLHDLRVADVNPDDISFMPFPYNKEGQQYASVELDYSYAINKNSEHKDLAREWIDYILLKSGFATSEGAISIKKGANLPDVLSNFQDVELVVNNQPTEENEGKYNKLNEMSGIYLDCDDEKERIILSALGRTEERFEEIMEDWDKRWNDARAGKSYNSEEESEEE